LRRKLLIFCAMAVVVLYRQAVVRGIVLHPDGEPNLAIWTDRPDSNTVGRWGTNASCVAISSNHVITTKHQGTSAFVEIGGITYTVDQVWTYPTADFRVVKLHSANLKSYVPMYTDIDEIGKPIVIGGFGKRREPADTTNPYAWTTEGSNVNNLLLFGTNEIDGDDFIDGDGSSYDSDILIAHFNRSSASDYECTIAYFDSGGGWFIDDNGQWKVAGLSRGLKWQDESYYTSPSDRNYLDAVRVSTYAGWVESLGLTICSEPLPGDYNGDCVVDHYDLEEFVSYWLDDDCGPENNYCQGSDFEPDGDVDFIDYSRFIENWMTDYSQL